MNEDIIGKRFGRLVVVGRGDVKNGITRYICKCDCGNTTYVYKGHLVSGATKSCGCLCKEVNKERLIKQIYKHGWYGTRLYGIWNSMKNRCNNQDDIHYKNYGGRGIKVCDEWYEFIKFKDWALSNGYDDKLSIDRIDNDGDYCPENCRWVTLIEQGMNKRNNHFIDYNGEKITMSELSRRVSIKENVLWNRIFRCGWTVEKAVSTPVKCYKIRGE